jgi:hypothetical protein
MRDRPSPLIPLPAGERVCCIVRSEDRSTRDSVLPLEAGEIIIRVFRGRRFRDWPLVKPGVGGDQLLYQCEILEHVAGDTQLAAGLERSFHVTNQRSGEDPSFLVPFLPPRVRKIDVDSAQARGGYEAGEQASGIAPPDFGVFELPLRQASGGDSGVFARQFNSEEVMTGIRRRGVDEEEPLAGADFELDRLFIAKNGRPSDWGAGVWQNRLNQV